MESSFTYKSVAESIEKRAEGRKSLCPRGCTLQLNSSQLEAVQGHFLIFYPGNDEGMKNTLIIMVANMKGGLNSNQLSINLHADIN